MAAISAESVSIAFQSRAAFLSTNAEVVRDAITTLADVGEQFEKAKDAKKVQQLKDAALALVKLEKLTEDRAETLRLLRQSYVASAEADTDFTTLLADGLREKQATSKFEPANSELYKDVLNTIAEVHGTAALASTQNEDDDDDVVVEPSQSGGLAPNQTCPLTMKPLLEIEDPVQDAAGFVYERSAIVQHIRSSRGLSSYVNCPVYGAHHKVAEKDVKPAKRVLRAKRRNRGRPAARSQAQRASQLDIIDL